MKWLLLLLLLCGVAAARPGGGQSFSSGGSHSYSGGSHSSSSSSSSRSYSPSRSSSSGGTSYSSGGGSTKAGNTALGIIVLLGVSLAVFVLIAKVTSRTEQAATYTSGAPSPVPTRAVSLKAVTQVDPDFSRIIFEDFAYELYAAAQRARHDKNELARLAPYLSETARTELQKRRTQVEQVVIGSMHIIRAFDSAYVDYKASRIIVRFESNLANRKGSTFAVERWTFERGTDRKTKPPPTGARTWPCPNCGAPWSADATDANTCAHCGTAITAGRLEWAVTDIEVDTETSVGVTLTGTTEEIGNDFATVERGDPHADFQKLRTDDPALTWPTVEDRVKLVYARLNDAWNAQDLTPARGLVTHSLLQYLQYWIDEYKRQGLANRLDDAKVKRIVLSSVNRDAYYDALVVRVFAAGRDYTLDGKKVVGGSRDKNRAYTEYWTFIRSGQRRGATVTAPNCPNCGAPLAISDAGACTHCNAHVESGEFDWVLSKIEQDDVYRG